jgi:DNA-binding phage protein
MARKAITAPITARVKYDVHGDNDYLAWLDGLRNIIERVMDAQVVDLDTLAENANVHKNTILRLLSGKTISPRMPTVYRILRGLGIALSADSPSTKRRRRATR